MIPLHIVVGSVETLRTDSAATVNHRHSKGVERIRGWHHRPGSSIVILGVGRHAIAVGVLAVIASFEKDLLFWCEVVAGIHVQKSVVALRPDGILCLETELTRADAPARSLWVWRKDALRRGGSTVRIDHCERAILALVGVIQRR